MTGYRGAELLARMIGEGFSEEEDQNQDLKSKKQKEPQSLQRLETTVLQAKGTACKRPWGTKLLPCLRSRKRDKWAGNRS